MPIRVAVRPGTGAGPPLLLCNGIGASLELLAAVRRRARPAVEVIRFDVPGVGGSPPPRRPYRLPTPGPLLTGLLDRARLRARRRPGHLLGRRARPAVRAAPPAAGAAGWCWWPPGRARSWCRATRASCCGCPRRGATGTPAHPARSPASCTAAPARDRPGAGRGRAARRGRGSARPAATLPAHRRPRLDQPAVAAAGCASPR